MVQVMSFILVTGVNTWLEEKRREGKRREEKEAEKRREEVEILRKREITLSSWKVSLSLSLRLVTNTC
jgi:hypothetical protein